MRTIDIWVRVTLRILDPKRAATLMVMALIVAAAPRAGQPVDSALPPRDITFMLSPPPIVEVVRVHAA